MGLIDGIIGGVAGLAQAKIESNTARRNVDATNAANQKMAEYSYSKDLEMWNKQNAYNSPEQQMERFKAAGLNPNLIYGQGSPGNATTMPKYNAPTQNYNYRPSVNLPQTISMFQDMVIKKQQITGQALQNKILGEHATQAGYDTLSKSMETLPMRTGLFKDGKFSPEDSYWFRQWQANFALKQAELSKTQADINKTNEGVRITKMLADFYEKGGKWMQMLIPFIGKVAF